ncbi:restriction endonuclease subunit S [Priestia aryabhattai]|uniref:restriction endonuclease subunit S n=1 Tax=Priestia aryabhattai TaxID=412384 RepID=UPI00234EDD90|nr:restriction endonuclease subunit S [Priestia aryabhattai]MDC7767280.1 restriction endonuclease subunit S [Priestia aryabhattai]
MKSNYKRIGDCIQLVDERNTDMKVKDLLGLSISKEFIPSVANIVGTDLKKYKIIRKNQFACSTMQVRRDKKMPVALLKNFDEAIISAAYPVFEVIDTEVILPEYLMMWFRRSEFDREACFYAIGGVRGSIEWEDFCNMQLPVPSITKQREIVTEFNVLIDRINMNNNIFKKLEETAQAIFKQWFLDFEFPNENGEPYSSNGGEMEFNKDINKDIPKGWKVGKLKDIALLANDKISIEKLTTKNYISTENMLPARGGVVEIEKLPDVNKVNEFHVGDTLISNIRPYFKKIWLANFDGGCSNDVLCFKIIRDIFPEYLYYLLERDDFFDYVMAGSKGTKMPRGDKNWIMEYPILLANGNLLKKFIKILSPLNSMKNNIKQETVLLQSLSNILLSKLATMEEVV